MQQYDAERDYRGHSVTDADGPFLTCTEAAARLGVSSNQAVRTMIRNGKLPARRASSRYNARYLLPAWAVDGLARVRGRNTGPDPEVTRGHERTKALENALAAVREAREFEKHAMELQIQSMQELTHANEILHRAVTNVLVPELPPSGHS